MHRHLPAYPFSLSADIRKEGPLYDLPILIALLSASRQITTELSDSAFLGELSLGGGVRRVTGVLPMLLEAKQRGLRRVFIPEGNAAEGAAVSGICVYPVSHVSQLISHLRNQEQITPVTPLQFQAYDAPPGLPDFADVKGQPGAKRALEIAAKQSYGSKQYSYSPHKKHTGIDE